MGSAWHRERHRLGRGTGRVYTPICVTAYGHNNDPKHGRGGPNHGLGLAAALILAAALGACFNGTGAEGLSCENDDDCGPDLSCDSMTGCCGGACLVPDTTTTTDTTTTDTTTTESTTTDSETDPSTTTLVPTTDGSTGDPIPFCGDFNIDAELGEECDDGELNNTMGFSNCTDQCLLADFLYAPFTMMMTTDVPDPPWNPSENTIDATLETDGWRGLMMGEWGSGSQPDPMNMGAHGVKTLVSSSFTIDASSAELILDHSLNFNVCASDEIYDGGRVYGIRTRDDMRFQIAPRPMGPDDDGWISEINADPGCAAAAGGAENPWAGDGQNAFVGQAMRMDDRFPIPEDLLGEDIYLEFHAAYDCSYCADGMPPPPPPVNTWAVRQVMVKPLAD